MNERFQKLAEQAGFYYTDKTGFITPAGCDPAKFARLIVQECIKINTVETTASNLPKYNLGMLEGYRRARENISIHFGVEE